MQLRPSLVRQVSALIASAILALGSVAAPITVRADASAFAPQEVVHALWLQTQGLFSKSVFGEPCSMDGMNDAEKRAAAATQNADMLSMWTEQTAFSANFAQCALDAQSSDMFMYFAMSSSRSGMEAIAADLRRGIETDRDAAKAKQFLIILKWLAANATNPVVKKLATDESRSWVIAKYAGASNSAAQATGTSEQAAPPSIADASTTPLNKHTASLLVSKAAQAQVRGIDSRCFPVLVDTVVEKGRWAQVRTRCQPYMQNAELPVWQAYIVYRHQAWSVACIKGDDVRPLSWAVNICGMTIPEATSFGFSQ